MTPLKLNELVKGVEQRNEMWFSTNNAAISYPDAGNDECLTIEDDSFWFKHRNRCIISVVNHFSPGKVFWDIGGGNGYVSMGLQNAGIETILVEPGENGALNAQRRGIKNVICSTLENIEVVPDVIEAAGMFDVIEHIEDDVEFMQKTAKPMRKGAMVYVTVPALGSLWSGDDIYAGHYRRYNLKMLEETFLKSGFEPVYSTYLFMLFPIPVTLMRRIPYLLRINGPSNAPEKMKREHSKENPDNRGPIAATLKWELNRVNQLKKMPVGTTCLMIGRKK